MAVTSSILKYRSSKCTRIHYGCHKSHWYRIPEESVLADIQGLNTLKNTVLSDKNVMVSVLSHGKNTQIKCKTVHYTLNKRGISCHLTTLYRGFACTLIYWTYHYARMYVCMYVCMRVCMYICMYVCVTVKAWRLVNPRFYRYILACAVVRW